MESGKNLERNLKPRHVEMIALGGTIGVGLFMGSASTIQTAGPAVLLCYALSGVVMFLIMRIMGEMLYLEPVPGSFAAYGYRYISPYIGLYNCLVLLVYVDIRRACRSYGGWDLHELLVPGTAPLGIGFRSYGNYCRSQSCVR